MILAIDPASTTGWAWFDGQETRSGAIDLRPRKATKGKPALAEIRTKKGVLKREARPAIPPTDDEPEVMRIFRFRDFLNDIHQVRPIDFLVHESPLEHHAGAKAAQVAWELRTTMVLFASEHNIPREEIKPFDLQRHALGRAARPKSNDMLDAARAFFGYAGHEHNEADAIVILDYGKKRYAKIMEGVPTCP